jgi:hypothetical protein
MTCNACQFPRDRDNTSEGAEVITPRDIKEIHVKDADVDRVIDNARQAQLGGKSHIRDRDARQSSLSEDQLVGQIATYCGAVAITGDATGYFHARDKANANPHMGDGGVDVMGLDNVDIKGSMMRRSLNPFDYRLLVRPQERHDGWIYVLALVPPSRPYMAFVIGWLDDVNLPPEVYNGPIKALHGTHAVNATRLHTIESFCFVTEANQ